eukprot:5984537-Amphidinium_carterae.1
MLSVTLVRAMPWCFLAFPSLSLSLSGHEAVLAKQMPDAEKRAKSDVVIDTGDDAASGFEHPEPLKPRVSLAFLQIQPRCTDAVQECLCVPPVLSSPVAGEVEMYVRECRARVALERRHKQCRHWGLALALFAAAVAVGRVSTQRPRL